MGRLDKTYSMNESIFCALAFGSVAIHLTRGQFYPCCNIDPNVWPDNGLPAHIKQLPPTERINSQTLITLRDELIQGKWPTLCTRCENSEKLGISSMRTIWNSILLNEGITMEKIVDPSSIKYLEMNFGNRCNSKCMTCNPGSSDFWLAEHKEIWHNSNRQHNVEVPFTTDIDELVNKIDSSFSNTRRISFLGGEPTLLLEHINFLKLLITSGKSQSIDLYYVTNLTSISDELINIWKQFKTINLSVSIDGFEKVNDYIRYPMTWDKVDVNFKKLLCAMRDSYIAGDQKFCIGLSCTLSIFNAIQAVDLLDYCFELTKTFKWVDHTGENQSLVSSFRYFFNKVLTPDYAMVNLLREEYRKIGIDRATAFLTKIQNYNSNVEVVNEGLIERIKLMIAWLQEPSPSASDFGLSRNVAKHFIKNSDKFRNRNIADYIPELWEELNK